MKKFLLFFVTIFCAHTALAQTVFYNQVDGKVHIKFNRSIVKPILNEDPFNIPLSKIPVISELVPKYGITKASRPFYQADDDDLLPFVIRLEFSDIYKINNLISDLQRISGVEYAEMMSYNRTTAVPNDPLFSTANGSVHLNQINAQNAWNVFNGNSNITVAIVDNAVMWTHADLVANTYTNMGEIAGNSIDDDNNGYIDDRNGWDAANNDNNPEPSSTAYFHGTHVAGIAGATTDNGIGVAGIGWNIKLIPVKCQYDGGPVNGVSAGYEGIIYAVKAKARIINCSWGNNGSPFVTEQAVIDYAWNRGSMVIGSASNFGVSTPNYPAAYNHAYAVAWVDPNDVKNSGSNYGTWVDISAPGSNIESTMPYTGSPSYGPFGGTSMSTPLVSGLAALMLSKSPLMTNTDVLNCISSTAVNIYTLGGNSSYVAGSQLGAGRIDAFAAMNCAATFSALPPVANFRAFPPKTCPNTPVQFYDSSLYAPTSWSWVFQAGSPATSSVANPTVTWTTPGTYSVMLTVSNANGSDAITKLSYITVAGPTPLPFYEGFENPAFLPSGWYPNNLVNDNIYWERKTGLGGYGTSTACAMFDNYVYNAPNEFDEMRTPGFDFSNVVSAQLKFDVAYARYNATYSDSLEVKLSTDCGVNWNTIYSKGGSTLATAPDASGLFVPTNSQWRTDVVDISSLAAGQGNVMFGFSNRGHYGQPIYLDNINLSFPTPTLNAPNALTVCVGAPVTFSNTSLGSSSYTWNFQGGTPATSSATSPVVSFASPGTYTVLLAGVNGTSTPNITRTVTVVSPPVLSLSSSASGTICAGGTVTLSVNGATNYTWTGGPQNTPYVVSPTASSIYTVSAGIPGCASSQTIGVAVGSVTISLSVSVSSPSICSGESATLIASGAASYLWNTGSTGATLVVSPNTTSNYIANGSIGACNASSLIVLTVMDLPISTITASNAMCFNSCDGSVNVNSTGSAPFTYSVNGVTCSMPCTSMCAGTYTINTKDVVGCISESTFTITEPPALNVTTNQGYATCSICTDATLTANVSGGTPPYYYTWSPTGGNNSVASNLSYGTYTVDITDGNGCAASQTVLVVVIDGLKEINGDEGVRIFPNPSSDQLNIETSNPGFTIALYNNIGQLILSKGIEGNSEQIDLRGFAKGVYLVEMDLGNKIAHYKLIIE